MYERRDADGKLYLYDFVGIKKKACSPHRPNRTVGNITFKFYFTCEMEKVKLTPDKAF